MPKKKKKNGNLTKVTNAMNENRTPKLFCEKEAKFRFPENARATATIFGKHARNFMLATISDVAIYGVVLNSAGKMLVENEAST